MINTFACKVVSLFVRNSRIEENDREIFVFGLEIILSSVASIITVFLISIPFRQFLGTVFYLIMFIIIRQFTGGYHANSYQRCFFTFVFIYLLTTLLVLFVSTETAQTLTIVFSWTSVFPVFLFAPVRNKNRELTLKETVKFRKISRMSVCLLAGLLTVSVFCHPDFSRILLWGALALLTTAILIVVAVIKNGGLSNEKNRD